MSTAIFPSLPGLTFPIKRTAQWKTRVPESVSGKRTFISDWSYPRYQWEVTFNLLRQAGANQQVASWAGLTYSEAAQLWGFFNQRSGRGDSFLYTEPDDNTSPTDQSLGAGDGTTTLFQLLSSFGGYAMPILAPNAVTNVKVNGTIKTLGTDYNVTLWGGTYLSGGGASPNNPGTVNFTSAPASGATITWTGTYYFPCQFDDDSMNLSKFMAAFYEGKSVKFSSLK
jgi:uncharacterized protein (TIGR02217 family)